MDKEQLADFIKLLDSEVDIREEKQFIAVNVPGPNLYALGKKLKENQETSFDFLFCLTGVDYGQDLAVVYHLRSTKHQQTVVLKVRTSDRKNPQFDSVTDIWRTAEFHEREVFDLLGIRFINHPDMRRFFLQPSYGFPLRKDFVDDLNIVTK